MDAASRRVVSTIPLSDLVDRMAFAADGRYLYVAGSSGLTVVDPQQLVVMRSFVLDSNPWDVAVSPSGDRAYVTYQLDDALGEIDLQTGRTVAVIKVGRLPQDLALSPAGDTAYVTDSGSGTVSVVAIGATPVSG